MPRVLFIAYDFPPCAGIGGGLRSANFVCYLPEFGWLPQVVALGVDQASEGAVIRLASPTPWNRPYEMRPYGWAYALRQYLRAADQRFDLVYVSCPPFPPALAATAYARRKGVPTVVDFRDAWSLDPYQEGSRLKRLLYRYLFPGWERKLLTRTDLLILNTPSALSAYQALYPDRAGDMVWLPNGYSEDAFSQQPPYRFEAELVLLHAGRFGIGARSPDNLLSGLALARTRGCPVRLEILGNQSDAVKAQIDAAKLREAVTIHAQVSYERAAALMCGAGALVLVQAPAKGVVQAVAGKTFDYLRAGRPILAIAPEGDNLELVRRHAHRHECPDDTPEGIAAAIISLWGELQRGLLREQRVDAALGELYERRALAAQLAALFDRVRQ